jgi:HTH-type transcriptional regulator / antitoxin HigA
MRTKKLYEYTPDYYVVPGETLEEAIGHLNMTKKEFAKRMDMTEQSLVRIIKGEQPITQDTAQRLELITGISNEFWINLEAQYQKQKQLAQERRKEESYKAWLKQLPVQELIKRKIINHCNDAVLQAREMLSLLRISSIDALPGAVDRMAAVARSSPAYATNPIIAFTYIALGIKEAERINVEPFDKAKLKQVLFEVKAMTVDLPSDFSTRLQSMFASAGVALVYIPELKGVRWNGVSKWLTSQKAMIIMNIRGKREDKFWFSLFHEVGHILLHGKKEIFISDSSPDSPFEREADKFASDTLIPESYNDRIVNSKSSQEIITIAHELGIAAGIVVGRYQHLTKVWSKYCSLVRKLDWKES